MRDCADGRCGLGDILRGLPIVNGGGIRVSIPAGDITLQNILSVHPFGNSLCVIEEGKRVQIRFLGIEKKRKTSMFEGHFHSNDSTI